MTRRRRLSAGLFLGLLLATGVTPAHALRVVTWNVLDYPNNNLAGRQPSLRTVVAGLNADLIIMQELKSQAGRDSFLTNVLNVVNPGAWSASGFCTTCESAVFYKSAALTLNFSGSVVTAGPRDVGLWRLRPAGYTGASNDFRVYSAHFKAGNTAADSTTRRQECWDLRNTINSAAAGTQFLIGGDTNFYGDWEGGYTALTVSTTDNDGRGKDPLTLPGTWNNFGYRIHHSQSTCVSGCGFFAAGGLDDRFDLWLTSFNLQDGEGLDLLPGGYGAYGNDGEHYNDAINGAGFNNAVGLTIANALLVSSDHLPVIADLQLPARILAASALPFGSVIVGATAQQNLSVTNSAVAPADELDYSFLMPAGFTSPTGPFSAVAAATNNHTITMSTASAGNKSGTLSVSTDAPDSLTKLVQFSGTVLAHAVASLDSAATVVEDSLDFGVHAAGEFTPQGVRVHNRGYTALQARLSLTGGAITGGAGRFAIVGGFTPSLLAGLGRTFEIYFDDTGATEDSTYEATLTFTSDDEPLPGATAQPDLVVHLRALVEGGTTAVLPGATPATLAFLPPRPNPVEGGTQFGFDLPAAAPVSLEIYDLGGRRVARVVDEILGAGRHLVAWTPRDDAGRRLSAGLYFARFQSGGFVRTHRLTLLP